MTIQFDIPQRFNVGLAETGVFFDIYNEDGDHYGAFKCRLMDQDSKTFRVQSERVRKDMERVNRNREASAERVFEEMFYKIVLVDWRDVRAGGKDVPYSEANARAYFAQAGTNFVMAELIRQCSDPKNYAEDSKEEVAGN